jgi:hypothetical protein
MDLAVKLDLAHRRGFDDAIQVRCSGEHHAQHTAVVYLDRGHASQLFQHIRINKVCVIDHYQHGFTGHAAMNKEFLGNSPQLTRGAGDFAETELSQKRGIEFLLAVAGFIDGRETDIIAEARDVAVQ